MFRSIFQNVTFPLYSDELFDFSGKILNAVSENHFMGNGSYRFRILLINCNYEKELTEIFCEASK